MLLVGCGAGTGAPMEPTSSGEAPEPEQQEEAALADGQGVAHDEADLRADAEDAQAPLTAAMPPRECIGEPCAPPAEFSQAFCKGRFPGLAVKMFEKGSPWKRMYVKVESLEAVNTYGGITTDPLVFTEEVLILNYQSSNSSGIKIGGASDVDVLRWDGTCATVREEMLSVHQMPTIKNATVTWRYLDKPTQNGLLEAKYVKVRYDQQKEACRSSSAANPTETCRKATEKLNDAITVAIRGGLVLPEPGDLPAWKRTE
jgi:hypothetical protein